MKIRDRLLTTTVAAACVLMSPVTYATENSGSTWPLGLENYLVAALPPPGLYGMVFVNSYKADKLKDNDGNTVPVDFSVKANVVAPRLVWVTNQTVLGGQLAFHAVAPLVSLDLSVAGRSQSKSGLGDIVFGPVLGYHHSANLHSVFVLDITSPTGSFDKNDIANIGRNYWSVRPMYGMSYMDPKGFNGDFLLLYNHNLKNKDTNYRSGDEVNVDYSLGWGLGNGWVVGIGGNAYQQIQDDEQNGQKIGHRGRAFAIGPNVKYQSDKGWFLTAKLQADRESAVRNRPEGKAFWLKAVFPL